MFKICAACLAIAALTHAQTPATVTFYAPGGVFKGAGKNAIKLGIGSNEAASQGFLYDSETKLGKLLPGRFATFTLTEGKHALGANEGGKEVRTSVDVDAKPGDHFFVRLTTTSKGAWIVQAFTAHLETVSCEQARQEADTTKPIQIKLVDKDARSRLVDGSYFPQCPK